MRQQKRDSYLNSLGYCIEGIHLLIQYKYERDASLSMLD